jgi:mono/diheme cytochrome c family protein
MKGFCFNGKQLVPVICATTIVILMQPRTGAAQQEEVSKAGLPAYTQYCGTCHGPDGKGDGPEAAKLRSRPTDLTQLRKMYKGDFPVWRLYAMIDGREEVRGHGTREMPIWGNEFKQQAGRSHVAESQTRGRIFELIYYIESLQEKEPASAK